MTPLSGTPQLLTAPLPTATALGDRQVPLFAVPVLTATALDDRQLPLPRRPSPNFQKPLTPPDCSTA